MENRDEEYKYALKASGARGSELALGMHVVRGIPLTRVVGADVVQPTRGRHVRSPLNTRRLNGTSHEETERSCDVPLTFNP